jgi:hypothetical protein
MKRIGLITLALLLAPTLASAQIPGAVVMGDVQPTPEQVEQAQNILAAAKPKPLTWNVGEFELVVKGNTAKGDLTWDSSDESVVGLREIPAGTLLVIEDAIRAGDKVRQDYEFKPQKESYFRARALKPGHTFIRVWANGDAGKKPYVIAKLDVTVGTPGPPPLPPPPPDADPLLKLAATDMAAGKGAQEDVDFYRSYLLTVANALPGVVQYKTSKEFWESFHAGWAGELKERLPSMRNAVGKILNEQVPEKEGDAFDADRRNKIAAVLKAVAARLETK